jgi:predicted porin
MRNVLLAGIALGTMALGIGAARAEDQPAAVFPVTSETDLAGWNGPSLNGAAPGSVQVNLGGRTFSAIWFTNPPAGLASWQKPPQPQFMSYFFLYPGFDYASPGGIHFGAQAQIRMTSSQQGEGAGGNGNSPIPWFQQYFTYVSSPSYGKLQFGIPNGALTENAVGQADDFGEGLFFGWYSTSPYIPWVMGDAYDNYVAQQKVVYTTPTIAGFLAAVSYQPTSVSANYADNLTIGEPPGATGLLSRNRVELAGKYAGTFGPAAFKANIAYVFAEAEKAAGGTVGQHVSFGEVGAQATISGIELEAQGETGKFNVALADNGSPMGPLPVGAKGTTAFTVGAGYAAGPIKVGAMYYGVQYDLADFGGPLGKTGRISGEGIGGAYTVGPGVVAYLDAYTASFDDPAVGNGRTRQYPGGIGIGTFFTW